VHGLLCEPATIRLRWLSDKPYSSGHPHGGHGPGHSPALRRLLSGRRRPGTEHQQTEASTWVNTANNIGNAAGASVAGLLIDRASISVGFAVGGVILGLTSVLIWLTHRSIEAKSCTCEAV
jgi:MFS family permease